jgi:DME family drug/metabolite transporter
VHRHPPEHVTAVVFGAAALALVPVAVAGGVGWVGHGDGALLALHLAVVTTALSYPMCNLGLRSVGAARAATLSLAEPATAAVLGLVVLDERLRGAGWAGLALVAAAVVVLATAQTTKRRRLRGP